MIIQNFPAHLVISKTQRPFEPITWVTELRLQMALTEYLLRANPYPSFAMLKTGIHQQKQALKV